MDNNSYYRLFLLFFIGLSLYTGAIFGSTSKVNDVSVKCIERERQALLKFKQGLVDDYVSLSSWSRGEDNKECCNWWGVKCSNRTGHVIVLDLHSPVYPGLTGQLSQSLVELRHLRYLDLSYNNFRRSQIGEVIGSLNKLKYLNLYFSNFTGAVPHQLGNLTRLKTLDLGWNHLTTKNLEWLSQLRSLRQLDLSRVYLNVTNWLQVIFNLPFLEELHLGACWYDRPIPFSLLLPNSSSESLSILDLSANDLTSSSTYPWLFNVSKNLVSIDLRGNNLEGPIPDAFGELISLEHIDLSVNLFEGVIPKSFKKLTHLRSLDLSYNKNLSESFPELLQKLSSGAKKSLESLNLKGNQLRGRIPESIGQLSELNVLDISSNFLEGEVSQVHFSRLSNLKQLYLSFNSLILNMSSKWVPTFQLDIIKLANCSIGPHFPRWLKTQNNFSELDLSFNGISNTLPSWFWDLSPKLEYLNLSYNMISGRLPELSPKFHGYPIIDLSSNNFSGPILSVPFNLKSLHLHKNMFMGSVSFLCVIRGYFIFSLDLSDNLFSGVLPNCWMNMTELVILNLGNNNFSGQIPKSLGFLNQLQTLHLRNNSFIGKFPPSLKDCMKLKVIDIGANKLTGNIPTWIGTHLTSLVILSLRSNKFHGNIPQDICHISSFQILDLSRNNITGKIPSCLYNLTSLVQKNSSSGTITFDRLVVDDGYIPFGFAYMDDVLVQWKRQESEYRKTLGYLKAIDLSNNELVGLIPEGIASLRGLISLNLSANHLTGNIIEHIGKMEMLESLDLSRNQLFGEIPTSLAHLYSLGVLNLSYNNLSGKIPSGRQLQTFDASAYIGNSELCGFPLEQHCPRDAFESQRRDHEKNCNIQNEDELITNEFYICMGLGFLFGLWGVFVIMLKASWRIAYSRFLQNTSDWLYVTSRVYMARLTRMIRG